MRKAALAGLALVLLAGTACGGQGSMRAEGAERPAPPGVGLHLAALQGDVDAVRQHIEAGTDLNARDAYGSTPLIVAATFGKTEVARTLLDAGADTEIENNDGSAPLHVAAFLGHEEIVGALLEAGADRYSRNMSGSTAYDIVAAPLEADRDVHDRLAARLAILGFEGDYERVERSRSEIAELLRVPEEDLEAVVYAPLRVDGWNISTPEEQGLDSTLVAELFLDASKLETLYGLLVIKDGHLVAEGYFNEGSVDRQNLLQSATKSFTSALVGIAIDRGCLTGVDQKMMDFFPEFADSVTDPRKNEVTIRDLLQMRAGYPWEGSKPELWEVLISGDYLRRTVELPLVNDPGAAFNYSNLSSHFLGVIVSRACDSDLGEFAQEHLLSPIKVELGQWRADRDGYLIGGGEIHLTARDAARFGQLYLDEGEFEGRQVVPADWIRESLTRYADDAWVAHERLDRLGRYFRDLGYGYQWWSASVGDHRVDYAAGHGGQYIVLLHDLDMVVVAIGDPFYLVHTAESWKHEQASLNVVGKFITSLPGE
ncbi:MAG: serine hydrolase [Candidatus Eisenbacteria bacterium]|nr:serine hydrolase [Candidatus Eisenbacteria bacterium]